MVMVVVGAERRLGVQAQLTYVAGTDCSCKAAQCAAAMLGGIISLLLSLIELFVVWTLVTKIQMLQTRRHVHR